MPCPQGTAHVAFIALTRGEMFNAQSEVMAMSHFQWKKTAGALCVLGLSLTAHAEVIRFEVTERVPAFEGRSFGAVGSYLRITGKATLALDPVDPRNAVIADIDKAPRNAAGQVQAVADVVILQPADDSKGNQTLLLDVPNRGRKLAPQLFDDAEQPGAHRAEKSADAGIGFLHRQGHTLVWVGWQSDIPSEPAQMALLAPKAQGITGAVRNEFQFDHLTDPVRTRLSADLADPASLKVTVRAHWTQERQTPADLTIHAVDAQTVEITRPKGFDAGALYEVTYQGKDPILHGMGFAATRDIMSFLRHDRSARNPLARQGQVAIQRAIGFGVSQSGRFLRDFLWLGFNEDLQGRPVFDGLMPHVAGARRMATNFRFGQPSRNSRHPQDPAWQIDEFPFTYAVLQDPFSGQRDGLLQKCQSSRTCPKIMQTDSEHEWWASRASLLVTDPLGNHIDLPAQVRAYMMVGTPHFADPGKKVTASPIMALPVNPMHAGPPMRALLTALNAWISQGTEPPASRVPMRAHGTLVEPERAVPLNIPGLPFDGLYTPAFLSDHSVLPPKVRGQYKVLTPLADADGMSVAGIRPMALAVPRATYTGWNPRAQGFAPGNLYPLQGAVVPFAATREDRLSAKDPRLSLQERYPQQTAYVDAVRRTAARFVAEGVLLQEDADRAVERAQSDQLSQLH